MKKTIFIKRLMNEGFKKEFLIKKEKKVLKMYCDKIKLFKLTAQDCPRATVR